MLYLYLLQISYVEHTVVGTLFNLEPPEAYSYPPHPFKITQYYSPKETKNKEIWQLLVPLHLLLLRQETMRQGWRRR
jgi:hypothetical protein